jgi:hypothetical protein
MEWGKMRQIALKPMEGEYLFAGKAYLKIWINWEEANCIYGLWEDSSIQLEGDWKSNFCTYKNATISNSQNQSGPFYVVM